MDDPYVGRPPRHGNLGGMSRALAHTLVVAILAALLAVAFWRSGYAFQWEGLWDYRQKFVTG